MSERWRAEKNGFYWTIIKFHGRLVVSSKTELHTVEDEQNYYTGNYFQEPNDATEKLDKIKKLLLEG